MTRPASRLQAAAAIIVTCPKCGRPRLYGHPCGYCGDPEPEAAQPFNSHARMQPPENIQTALYGHLCGCTGHVSPHTGGAAP